MVVYNIEKSNVLLMLQTYCYVDLKESINNFEFLKKRFSIDNSFVYFPLVIVLSVLLRYTIYPFWYLQTLVLNSQINNIQSH
jgi:hypothetical protein